MKKRSTRYTRTTSSGSVVKEVYIPYGGGTSAYSHIGDVVDLEYFNYSDFKIILDKSPFTIGEWSQLLYISERTLHRYGKENSEFNGLQIERILLLEDFIDTGNDLLGDKGLKQWVHSAPFSLGGRKVFDSLFTYQGIRECIDLLMRLQHGIPA